MKPAKRKSEGSFGQQAVARDRPQVTFQGRSIDIRSYLKRFLFEPHRTRDRVSSLSGGERARVALTKLLLTPANVLVLDEPTNDLNVAMLSALEEMLVESESTALGKPAAEKATKKPRTDAAPKGSKLSYKEKQELERIVGEIERLETEIAEVEATLNKPTLYADRADEVPAILEQQRDLKGALDAKMERWMELEAKAGG